jgi:hypothetical protein
VLLGTVDVDSFAELLANWTLHVMNINGRKQHNERRFSATRMNPIQIPHKTYISPTKR